MLSHRRRTMMVWEAVAIPAERIRSACLHFSHFLRFASSPTLPTQPSSLRAPLNIKRVVCWFFYKNKANKNIKKTKHRQKRGIAFVFLLQIKSILKRKGRRAWNIYPPPTPEARCDSVGNIEHQLLEFISLHTYYI